MRPDEVPANLRPFLESDYVPDASRVDFTYDGFVLIKSDETLEVPTSLDVPNISHPVGGTMDIVGGRLFGVTFGGEGFIYQYDIAQNKWSVLASMEGVDAAGLFYDPQRDRLIFGLGVISEGLLIYDIGNGQFVRVPVNMKKLPGYFDLFDPGNGPGAALLPIAVSGDLALIRSTPDRVFNRNATRSRTYLINLATGDATLVAFTDG